MNLRLRKIDGALRNKNCDKKNLLDAFNATAAAITSINTCMDRMQYTAHTVCAN